MRLPHLRRAVGAPRRLALWGTLALLLLAAPIALGAGALSLTTAGPVIPPVGNQQTDPPSQCSSENLGSTIHTLFQHPTEGGPGGVKVATHFSLDPYAACHQYMSYRSSIMRSDNGGHTFDKLAFQDLSQQQTIHQGPITISQTVPAGAAGDMFMYDQTGQNGVFFGSDYHNWSERDGGLYSGTGPTGGIVDLEVAPSSPSTVYLLGTADVQQAGGGPTPVCVPALPGGTPVCPPQASPVSTAQSVLFASNDSGSNWRPIPPPTLQVTTIAVDPTNPSHIYAAGGNQANNANGSAAGGPAQVPGIIWDSSNGGTSWQPESAPDPSYSPDQIFVTRVNSTVVVYARTNKLNPRGFRDEFYDVSFDGMKHWHEIGVVASDGRHQSLAYDPANPRFMVIAGDALDTITNQAEISIVGSADGFQTTPYSGVIKGIGGSTDDMELRAGNDGNFFLKTTINGTDTLYGFNMSAIFPRAPAADRATGVPPLHSCPLPAGGGTQGSVAFDGTYLDYADEDLTPGTIFRMQPSCVAGPPITIPPQGGATPYIYELTYDPKITWPNGDVGALLVRADGRGTTKAGGTGQFFAGDSRLPSYEEGLYAVDTTEDPQTKQYDTVLLMPLICRDPASNNTDAHCLDSPAVLSFNPYLNAIWGPVAIDPTSHYPYKGLIALPDQIPQLGTGIVVPNPAPIPTCMSSGFDANLFDDQLQFAQGPSDWVQGGKGIIYIQGEDDATVVRVDSVHCTLLDWFAHKPFVEGSDENDQGACDPLSFSDGGVWAQTPPTSALWTRDDDPKHNTSTLRAYPISDGFCPFPTGMAVKAPKSGVAGDTITGCSYLTATVSGVRRPVTNRNVQFTLAGHPLGGASTDANGAACISFSLPSIAGTVPLLANFAGTEAYMPATASQSVLIYTKEQQQQQGQGGHGGRTLPLVQPQPQPPAALIPPPPAPVPQVQTQFQAQAQAQSQSQPGAMTQKQRQTRVSLARLDGGRTTADLEATALPAVGTEGAGLALFGLALILLDRRRSSRRVRPRLVDSNPRRRPRS